MKKDNLDWKVRNGDEKDIQGILSLRKIVFGEFEKDKLDPKYWKWEFLEGPDGRALIYLVEDHGRIIGHFADLLRRFSICRKIALGTISVDLMVAPEFRRRGIFEEMGRYAIQRVKERNGIFMSAFPIRPQTINGFKKIGWVEIFKLPILVYPIKFSGILNTYLHSSYLSFFFSRYSENFLRLFYFRKEKRCR